MDREIEGLGWSEGGAESEISSWPREREREKERGYLAGGEDGGLVHEVSERGAREPRATAGDHAEVDVLLEGLAARVHTQDGHATLHAHRN